MQAGTPQHTKHKANNYCLQNRHKLPAHGHTRYARLGVLQFYVACKGLNVTTTIHTVHAQKHFSPETKSKVESASKKKIRPRRWGTVCVRIRLCVLLCVCAWARARVCV